MVNTESGPPAVHLSELQAKLDAYNDEPPEKQLQVIPKLIAIVYDYRIPTDTDVLLVTRKPSRKHANTDQVDVIGFPWETIRKDETLEEACCAALQRTVGIPPDAIHGGEHMAGISTEGLTSEQTLFFPVAVPLYRTSAISERGDLAKAAWYSLEDAASIMELRNTRKKRAAQIILSHFIDYIHSA
ncbi:MAG TPA: hypothetical protein VMY99_04430 [Nevskiaceae bacterium]|nr:hypothetical protein [Nevskiaceae bacterium]